MSRLVGLIGAVLDYAFALCFVVGLAARVVRWLNEGGFGRKRRKDSSARHEQWASREIADEVPVHRRAAGRRMLSGTSAPSRRR